MLQTIFPTSPMSEVDFFSKAVAPMGLNFRRAMQSDAQPAAEPSAKPKKRVDGRGMIGGRTGQEQIKSQLSNPPAPCFLRIFADTGWWRNSLHFLRTCPIWFFDCEG